MTTPLELYRHARELGLELEPRGDKLAVSPKGACPPDFAAVLRKHKGELLTWLSRSPRISCGVNPPEDLPLNPVMPQPRLQDRERVIGYLLRQGCNRPGPLTAWLVRRENAYFEGPGRTWDCALHAYAAARDAACWQLNRGEAEMWLLVAFEEAKRRSA